jgi:branched-chain amino acid transport system substrate-binding protein
MKLTKFIGPVTVVLGMVSGGQPAYAEVRIGLGAPLTGPMAWAGAVTQQSAEFAVADLNARGGVLGEQMEIVTADDYCEGPQAMAAAHKLVAEGVVAVFGHQCSGAAIPASKIYADAGILMLSTFATNPKLTEQGFRNVFRVVGRDDVQGRIAGDLLAERWSDKPIAILHDGQARPTTGTSSRRCRRWTSRCSIMAVISTKQGSSSARRASTATNCNSISQL